MKYTNNAMYSAVAVRSDYIVCFRFHLDLLVFGLAGHLFGITGHVSLMDLEQLCLKPRFTYIYGESPRINRRPKKKCSQWKMCKNCICCHDGENFITRENALRTQALPMWKKANGQHSTILSLSLYLSTLCLCVCVCFVYMSRYPRD